MHILDIIENSIRAGAGKIHISVIEDNPADLLQIIIKDDGRGMDKNLVKQALDPFFTTKPDKKTGLGLALFAQAAQASGGSFTINSVPHTGTEITAVFKMSHPDMQPLGDVAESVDLMKIAHPEIAFRV